MPDPAKTAEEIEDVLASIRRLVSDQPSDSDASIVPEETTGQDIPTEQGSAERLVLTPSFRVTEPDEASAPSAEPIESETATASDDDDGDNNDLSGTDSLLLNVLAGEDFAEASEVPASDAATGDAETSEASDTSGWQPDDRMANYDTVGADAESDMTEAQDTQTESAEETPIELDSLQEGEAPADDNAEVDHADIGSSAEDIADLILLDGAGPTDAEFESETGDENWPGEGAEAALLTLVARREPDLNMTAPEDEDQISTESASGEDGASSNAVEPEQELAQGDDVEVAENTLDLSDEPTDQPSLSEASEPAQEIEDASDQQIEIDADVPESNAEHPEAAVAPPVFSRRKSQVEPRLEETEGDGSATNEPATNEPAHDGAEDIDEAPTSLMSSDAEDGILDEETLREIIVEVVREELQGVLGQRITRNVRKMVRREIRLALAAEDLD